MKAKSLHLATAFRKPAGTISCWEAKQLEDRLGVKETAGTFLTPMKESSGALYKFTQAGSMQTEAQSFFFTEKRRTTKNSTSSSTLRTR